MLALALLTLIATEHPQSTHEIAERWINQQSVSRPLHLYKIKVSENRYICSSVVFASEVLRPYRVPIDSRLQIAWIEEMGVLTSNRIFKMGDLQYSQWKRCEDMGVLTG